MGFGMQFIVGKIKLGQRYHILKGFVLCRDEGIFFYKGNNLTIDKIDRLRDVVSILDTSPIIPRIVFSSVDWLEKKIRNLIIVELKNYGKNK